MFNRFDYRLLGWSECRLFDRLEGRLVNWFGLEVYWFVRRKVLNAGTRDFSDRVFEDSVLSGEFANPRTFNFKLSIKDQNDLIFLFNFSFKLGDFILYLDQSKHDLLR